jgi:hypothetical protein
MTDVNLTQNEADLLLAMEKVATSSFEWEFPTMGMKIEIPLLSENKREKFLLDISRGTIDLKKVKYQNRTRQVIVLARVDLSGSTHRNPDSTEIPPGHIHKYREGYADKWAYPIPKDVFHNLEDQWEVLQDFMNYCNITEKPKIKKVLF